MDTSRVSGVEEVLGEHFVQKSDVYVEGNLNRETVPSSGCEIRVTSGSEVCVSGDEEWETRYQAVNQFSAVRDTEQIDAVAKEKLKAVMDAGTSSGLEFSPIRDTTLPCSHRNSSSGKDITSMIDGKQVAELVSGQVNRDVRMESNPGVESLNGGDCFTVDLNSNAEVTNEVAEAVVDDVSQVKEVSSSLVYEDQNLGTHASEISSNESIMGSLIVDLSSSFGIDGGEGEVRYGLNENAVDVGKSMTKSTEQIAGSIKENQARYCLKTKKEGDFATSDLVWGKVKSHPWWPGQIFDPSDASKKAMKHYKKGRLLVAYFGDQSFAWNEPSSLKPFKIHFSQMEKQTNMVGFQDAVNCALDEVSRRVELGLSCSCTPEEIYSAMTSQIVINAGIREEVFNRNEVDRLFNVTSFEPSKLVKYIKALALGHFYGGDRLELVVAQSQLVAFYSSKGYFHLPEFHVSAGISGHAEHATPAHESKEEAHIGKEMMKNQHEKFLKLQDKVPNDVKSGKKERCLTDLIDRKNSSCFVNGVDEKGAMSEQPSSKKRKAIASSVNESKMESKKQKYTPVKICDTESPTSRATKVGERIRKIARQLAGSPPVLKYTSDSLQKSAANLDGRSKKLHEVDLITQIDGRTFGRPTTDLKDCSSLDEMLSQLCLVARDPMKGYSFVSSIVSFFVDFRDCICVDKSCSTKRKLFEKRPRSGKASDKNKKPSPTEPYGCEAASDSYWTDRIIQSSPEDSLSRRGKKRKVESQLETPSKDITSFETETSRDLNSILNSKKDSSTVESAYSLQLNTTVNPKEQCIDDNSNLATEKSVGDKKNSAEFSPTALILKFTDANSIPLESDLNGIFGCFGSLKESETEILRKTRRARVVFQRRNDAEEAFRSACKYSVFGPALVSYELKYFPSTPSKASSCISRQSRGDVTSLEGNTLTS
ncbi:Tudor/PWWP/MBT superfamily protein [Thalictrum thalictroides]|uniref:Tudor/PWWP/MBT superfamily protein n=1 Tax=Thalictrum thalictroides TaxID=46969 RepID=A0A7J6XBT2_THATH|nr:Tudor/PWWP/MBT superfamily protein [Thalictrum thalictroides]